MLKDLIKTRKSVRSYQEKDIPNDVLKTILEAGHLAPSWMNSQPWKFILVKNENTKELLSKLSLKQPHVKNAKALIVCVADENAWSKEVFGKVLASRGIAQEGQEKIFNFPMLYPPLLGKSTVLARSLEQVTYAISYMMLQAWELGVSSCVIGAISNKLTVEKEDIIEEVNKALNLKKGENILTILTLGYMKEDEPKEEKQRKDFDEVIFQEKIGNKIDF